MAIQQIARKLMLKFTDYRSCGSCGTFVGRGGKDASLEFS